MPGALVPQAPILPCSHSGGHDGAHAPHADVRDAEWHPLPRLLPHPPDRAAHAQACAAYALRALAGEDAGGVVV